MEVFEQGKDRAHELYESLTKGLGLADKQGEVMYLTKADMNRAFGKECSDIHLRKMWNILEFVVRGNDLTFGVDTLREVEATVVKQRNAEASLALVAATASVPAAAAAHASVRDSGVKVGTNDLPTFGGSYKMAWLEKQGQIHPGTKQVWEVFAQFQGSSK